MPDPLKLSIRTWLVVHVGLNSLDAIREGQDIVALDYDAATRMTLLRTAQMIEREKALFDRLDRDAAAKHGVIEGMAVTPENAVKLDAYRREVEAARDVEVELPVVKIKLGALLKRPDGKLNRVPQSVLGRLAPIIADE